MVKPGGTGRPRLAISARFAPLPPKSSRIALLPSARPSPNVNTHLPAAGTAARGSAFFATTGFALLTETGFALFTETGFALFAETGFALATAFTAAFGSAFRASA